MAGTAYRRALPLVLLLLAGCERGPGQGAASPAERGSTEPAGAGLRLALLEPGGDMFLAALEGVLHAEGRCLYIVGNDAGRSRTLPAFHIADMSWDSGTRSLKVGGRAFALGEPVLLTGGRPPTTAGLRWVQRPDPSCDSSDIFVAGAIDPAKASPP